MKLLFTHRRNNDFTRDKQQDSGRNIDFKIQECFSGVCICEVKCITRQLVNTGKGGVLLLSVKESPRKEVVAISSCSFQVRYL
jgi:hypothetical protein